MVCGLVLTGCGAHVSQSATCKLLADPAAGSEAGLQAEVEAFGHQRGYGVKVVEGRATRGVLIPPFSRRPAVRLFAQPEADGAHVVFFYSVPGAYSSERVQADVRRLAVDLGRNPQVGLRPLGAQRLRSLRGVTSSACLETAVKLNGGG